MSQGTTINITSAWAREAPLHEVCIHIADTYLENRHSLDGKILANLATRIIASEVHPGGPYKNNAGVVDPYTNLSICYLFAALKKPLMFTDSLLQELRSSPQQPPRMRSLLLKFNLLVDAQANPSPTTHETSEKSYRLATQEFHKLQRPARDLALSFLERLKHADKNNEITLIPTIFFESLTSPICTPPLVLLGEANIYCWIAYTIYDHILDGKPLVDYLPVGNIATRLALQRYQALFPKNHPFQRKIINIFTGMDMANSWELKHCRFPQDGEAITISRLPSYGHLDFLARRSLGHVLGPLAVAAILSHTKKQTNEIEKGLHHYLIARQLSDDIHDWQEDIRAGHSSAVVTYILKSQEVKAGSYVLDPLVEKMQVNFWQHSMQATNDLIHHHANLAHHHFTKSGLLKKDGGIMNLVLRLNALATESSNEKERYEAFSSAYRSLLIR